MLTRLSIAVFVAATSAALLAQSAQDKEPPQPRPTFRAEANYVRVDMYATVDGHPVEDLAQSEIEILEDGSPQKIATFEHVKVRPAGPQETRIEPNTIEQSRQAAADPRSRVFVIFLDTYNVQIEGSHNVRTPVVRFIDRVVGQDDLVAVFTPEMAATDLTFGRKTTVIAKMMEDEWHWGRRERVNAEDPKEQRYQTCYPENPARGAGSPQTEGIAFEMIERRRERLTLEALDDLVAHLSGIREERKAVLTISEGWRLFGVNRALAAPIKVTGGSSMVPDGRDPVFVGPDGKLRRGANPRTSEPGSEPTTMAECDADRIALAEWDGGIQFRALTERANRGNVSFYTVYPRGLAVFDAPIGPRRPPPIVGEERRGNHDTPSNDMRNLSSRHNSLRELAENTDAMAVINQNNLEPAMQRIVSDLSSYYLVGYYSTNTRLDGKFREISVRVKRPSVRIRARRGYRGATAEELTSNAAAEKAKAPSAVSRAFDNVAAVSPRSQLRVRTAAWTSQGADDAPAAAVWIVGEIDYGTRKDLSWSAGAVADVVVVSATGADVASQSIPIPAGQGTFTVRLPEAGGVAPGEYAVRVRVKPNQDSGLPVSDTARVIVPSASTPVGESVLWRRGPTTGPRYATTADPRFRRNERVRLEHATTAAGMPTARMLDRGGNLINVPVQVTERADESGEFRWLVAESALAPLAPGDYAIEITLDESKVVTAFKVVP